jgi:hypothetical protein
VSNKPGFITEFTQVDKYNRTIPTVRVSEAQQQLVIDFQTEWECGKSDVIRGMIDFMGAYYQQIAELNLCPVGVPVKLSCNVIRYLSENRQKKQIKDTLMQLYGIASVTTNQYKRDEMLKTAQEYAELHDIEWPPPESVISLLTTDPEARYVMDRVIQTATENESSRITLRQLQQKANRNKDECMEQLEKLVSKGYVQMDGEQRSGPETTWIDIPTMELR